MTLIVDGERGVREEEEEFKSYFRAFWPVSRPIGFAVDPRVVVVER